MTNGSFASLGTAKTSQTPTSSHLQSDLSGTAVPVSPSVAVPPSLPPPSPLAVALAKYRYAGSLSSSSRSGFVFVSPTGRYIVVPRSACHLSDHFRICQFHDFNLPAF